MRRLFRILRNTATLLSLLLCLATVGLWVRSYFNFDLRGYETKTDANDRRLGGNISSAAGTLTLTLWERVVPGSAGTAGVEWSGYSTPLKPASAASRQQYLTSIGATKFLGVAWAHYKFDPRRPRSDGSAYPTPATARVWHLELPHFMPAIASALLPAVWLWRRLRRRKGLTLCPNCGYDVRATPDRCPECGTNIATGAGVAES